jgi:galactokinase
VRLVAVDYDNDTDEFDLREEIAFQPKKMWSNYIRGVIKCLIERGFEDRKSVV